jgi:hypothetical protein
MPEHVGHRVTRLGVGKRVSDLKRLWREEYRALNLPPQLRTLPDLLVCDADMTWPAIGSPRTPV